MESLLLTGCPPRVVPGGATPRGQPWTSAVPLPPGRNGLGARRMAVLSTFRALSLGRHVHRELMRSALLNLTPIIAATACYQRNYVERYSRSIRAVEACGSLGVSKIGKSLRPLRV